ncbi:hypothetical protein, partial [Bacillus wiedmannii]
MTNLQIKIFSISKLLLFSIFAFVFTLIVQTPGKAAASANYTQTTETINGVNYSVITVNYSGDDA